MITEKEKILNIISGIYLKNGNNLREISSDIIIKGHNIGFSMNKESIDREEAEKTREIAISELKKELGFEMVTITLTSKNPNLTKEHYNNLSKPKQIIEGVKKIILISSGKGGVGKSTVASIIAENLSALKYNVGLLDADIYGPSIPTIFGVNKEPEIKNGKIVPIIARGIQINSIGFLNKTDSVLAWRGPMVSKAIYQLLSLTMWNNLDYLIIDMPPGTGDISLAILENYKLHGVIIVTTPQKIAQIDVKKSIELYNKFKVPIFGIIENMSYFLNEFRQKIPIFLGESGAILSKEYNLKLIHKIPIIPEIAFKCDTGESLKNIINIPLDCFY